MGLARGSSATANPAHHLTYVPHVSCPVLVVPTQRSTSTEQGSVQSHSDATEKSLATTAIRTHPRKTILSYVFRHTMKQIACLSVLLGLSNT